jgi:type I restriction enzyme S subunit
VVPELPGAACFGSTEFHVLRAEPGIQARWIANYLLQHSTRHTAQRQMTGGVGQMRVPSAFLETLSLPLPPEPEQVRILDTLDELLSDLDAGVATLERVRAKLKHYRAAVLKAAVEGALTAEWRRQHPATETGDALLTRILAERRRLWEEAQLAKFEAAGKTPPKDWKAKYSEPIPPDASALPTLPEHWCWASLDQVCEIQGGLQKQPGRVPREHHFPYLRVANVHRGFVDLTELKRSELTEVELLRHRLKTGR